MVDVRGGGRILLPTLNANDDDRLEKLASARTSSEINSPLRVWKALGCITRKMMKFNIPEHGPQIADIRLDAKQLYW